MFLGPISVDAFEQSLDPGRRLRIKEAEPEQCIAKELRVFDRKSMGDFLDAKATKYGQDARRRKFFRIGDPFPYPKVQAIHDFRRLGDKRVVGMGSPEEVAKSKGTQMKELFSQ